VALEARLHGCGVHRLAVVKRDPAPKLDRRAAAVVGGIGPERQLRDNVEVLVDVEQLVA
jgi:hypothetical protein